MTTPDTTTIDFIPKTSRYGDVRWTGYYTKGHKANGTTYAMVRAGTTGACRETSSGIIEVVQHGRVGWRVLVHGQQVAFERLKNDAQRVAEALVGVHP